MINAQVLVVMLAPRGTILGGSGFPGLSNLRKPLIR